jgi:hypothetical protein
VALATVYQKHSSVLTLKVDVYRMTRAQYQKVKEGGHWSSDREAGDRSPGKQRP